MEINLSTINRLKKWKSIGVNPSDDKNSIPVTSLHLKNTLQVVDETLRNPSNKTRLVSNHIDSSVVPHNDIDAPQQNRGPSVLCQSDEWAFLSLFVEAARANKTQEDLDIFLLRTIAIEEHSTRQSICEFYGRIQPRLTRQLLQIGSHLKHIVDVKCRMDYQVTNTINGRACDGDPTYIVELTCQNPNRVVVEQINLSCTLFELQDLVNQLKDAKRMCERNSVMNKEKDNARPVITLFPSNA